jgi:Fe-S-cluster containining protein
VKGQYPSCVKCKIGCVDCCYALFDLTLIEALYIKQHFKKTFSGKDRETIIEKSNKADRSVYRIKRNAYKAMRNGKTEDEILADFALERERCPLLNDRSQCDLYQFRPVTCRLYGIPTSINGRGHTCGTSGFTEGEKYPTANLDRIQQKLFELSAEFIRDIRSKHVKMSDMLVPVSMALLTGYDEIYLGIAEENDKESEE